MAGLELGSIYDRIQASRDKEMSDLLNTWICPFCTLHTNDRSLSQCTLCGTRNPNHHRTGSDASSQLSDDSSWQCPSCTLINDCNLPQCSLCFTPNPNIITYQCSFTDPISMLMKDTEPANETFADSLTACNGDLSDCLHLTALKAILVQIRQEHVLLDTLCGAGFSLHTSHVVLSYCKKERYLANDGSELNSNEAVSMCLDHFLHLQSDHDTNVEFDTIYRTLSGNCKPQRCAPLRRNLSRRYAKAVADRDTYCVDPFYQVRQEIVDKIHCYYAHTYDTGHRFTPNENSILRENNNDEHGNLSSISTKGINSTLRKIYCEKHNLIHSIIGATNMRDFSRFSFGDHSNIEQKSIATAPTQTISHPVYEFGFPFIYKPPFYNKRRPVNITAKYASLKEEMIHNQLSRLTIHDYDNQYFKSEMHCKSPSGRKYIADHIYIENAELANMHEVQMLGGKVISMRRKYPLSTHTLKPSHVLAVMIYCNYDSLQAEFTMTFIRKDNNESEEDVCHRHSKFYHFGLLLKDAVSLYGTKCKESKINRFYHGLREKYMFPHLFTDRISVYGPVSTTKEFAIALVFASEGNDGIILEFTNIPSQLNDEAFIADCIHPSTSSDSLRDRDTFHFECRWISDFPTEQECLFLQASADLVIVDIQDTHGFSYGIILEALKMLKKVVTNDFNFRDNVDAEVKDVMNAIVQNEILGFQKYELKPYASCLIKQWFKAYREEEDDIVIDWRCHVTHDFEWRTVDCLDILFPNTVKIVYKRFDLSSISFMMDSLYRYFDDKENRFHCVHIENDENEWSEKVVSKYNKPFAKIKISVTSVNNILIVKCFDSI
eukprot:953738_1